MVEQISELSFQERSFRIVLGHSIHPRRPGRSLTIRLGDVMRRKHHCIGVIGRNACKILQLMNSCPIPLIETEEDRDD